MASLSTSSPSSALAPPPAPPDPIGDDIKTLRAQQTQLQNDSDKVEADETKALQATEARRDDLIMHPPQMQQAPAPKAEATNPTKAWGSMAMIMAGLGALMTRTPMTTALNAAAGVLHAYQKGDADEFAAKFKAWQVANDNAKEIWEFQQKQYDNILGQLDRSENLTREEARDHVAEIRGKLTATAAALRDDQMMAALKQNDLHFAQTLQLNRQRVYEAFQEHSMTVAEAGAFNQAMNDFRVKNPTATGDELVNKMGELKAKMSPSHTMTPYQQTSIEQRIQGAWKTDPTFKAYSAAENYLGVLDTMYKDGPQNVAGVIRQAGFLDQWNQLFNGGRAIRGFQQKLATEHAGIWNRLAIIDNQLKHPEGGGILSSEMIHDMKVSADEYASYMDAQMRDSLYRTKQRAFLEGANPANVAPPGYDPNKIHELTNRWWPGATPTEHIIDLLEQGKISPEAFDQHYKDPNAAAMALAIRKKERESAAAAEGAVADGEQ